MKVIWSDEATRTFDDVVNDILNKHSEKEVNLFLEKSFAVIDAIESYPKLYPKHKIRGLRNVHKAAIHPHTTLFYEVEKTHIELLFFWLNKTNPEKLF